jgi:hypothetical protein
MKGIFFAIGLALGYRIWRSARLTSSGGRPVETPLPSSESVDIASEDSFPASDPPSTTGAHI